MESFQTLFEHQPWCCIPAYGTTPWTVYLNWVCFSTKWEKSRTLLRGEYGKVDYPSNDTEGDICHLLLLWPFCSSSNTHYTEKWTQSKGEKIEPSSGTLFIQNQLVYSSFSNMKCCWTCWIISLPSFKQKTPKLEFGDNLPFKLFFAFSDIYIIYIYT